MNDNLENIEEFDSSDIEALIAANKAALSNIQEFDPTKRGFRLDPGAFASLISMLEDNRYMVFGITRADGSGEEEKNTNHSEHLLEQVVS